MILGENHIFEGSTKLVRKGGGGQSQTPPKHRAGFFKYEASKFWLIMQKYQPKGIGWSLGPQFLRPSSYASVPHQYGPQFFA